MIVNERNPSDMFGSLRKPNPEEEWALGRLNEYAYRDKFGLSQKEYLEEEISSVTINSIIMGHFGEEELKRTKREQKKAKRKRK